eukprot:Rhum_TRINITY_DN14678_c0_g1::Rhum_TRINITY_DN14678_c0_g1_i3::g.107330::m.107330
MSSDNSIVLTRRVIAVTLIGLYKTSVGTGVLSMPKALESTGIALFAILLFGFAALSAYSCSLVAKTLDMINCPDADPARIGEFALGKFGKWSALALCFLDPWLSTVAFFSTLADTIRPMLREKSVFGEDSFFSKDGTIVFILAVLIYPLMLSTKVAELGWINILGVVALISFAVALGEHAIEENRGLSDLKAFKSSQALVALAVIGFAYDGCQMNVFPFYRGLPQPDRLSKSSVLIRMCTASNTLGAFTYFAIALMGYSSYQADTDKNLLDNFPDHSAIYVTIKIALASSILLSIPITLFECSNVLREHIFGDSKLMNAMMNFFLIGFAALLAVAVSDMYVAFAYVGATTATAWTMIVPPLWFIYTSKRVFGDDDDCEDDVEEGGATESDKLIINNNTQFDVQPLIDAPSSLEISCAWILMVTGIIAIPLFVYSTAKGNDSSTTPAPHTLAPLTHSPINATDDFMW